MRKILLAGLLLLMTAAGTSCSNPTEPRCTMIRVEATESFIYWEGDYRRSGGTYDELQAMNAHCTLRRTLMGHLGPYPMKFKVYSCVVCTEEYPEN